MNNEKNKGKFRSNYNISNIIYNIYRQLIIKNLYLDLDIHKY